VTAAPVGRGRRAGRVAAGHLVPGVRPRGVVEWRESSTAGTPVAESVNLAVYSDALVVLATAGVVVPLVRRWGLNPILGYLGAGAVLGPLGLGSFIAEAPWLYWLTVVDAENVRGIADLGIVFLLFLIGLELSFARLVTMRRHVFGLGALQVVTTAAVLGGGLAFAGVEPGAAVVLGSCMALSSTAIVVELLASRGRLATGAGRAAFAVLLAQDIAVIPILLVVSALAGGEGGSVAGTLAAALGQAAVAFAVIAVLGRMALRPLFRLVAAARSTELMLATILFVIVGTGFVAALAGVSMALGAFVAGLLLAETEYRKAIESLVEPFKGLLLGIFFFTVGMSIDLREIAREPLFLAAAIAGLVVVKTLVLAALARAFRLPWGQVAEVSLVLGPGGEFAFVGIGAAVAAGVVDGETAGLGLTVATLSMALIPALDAAGRRLAKRLQREAEPDPELAVEPVPETGATLVVGHGRVGKVVCAMLKSHGRPYLACDLDAVAVSRDRRQGGAVFYGDASSLSFLTACGIRDAAAVIVTINDPAAIDAVVAMVRQVRPDIPIFSRAKDAAHARHLYAMGVTDAVPETIEASLQLSETALVGIGVPTGPVIASIHGKRDEFRDELQQAARRGGRSGTRGLRGKSGTAA
jgi:CPA2 family monovalent cation:H+ antiporter-2